jgi:ell wall binding domain 2 (CWB2)
VPRGKDSKGWSGARPISDRAALLPAAAALLASLALAGCSLGDDSSRPPQLGARSGDEEARAKLGFPEAATRNTIRVGGGDATADAAGVANALFPSTGEATRPTAAILVDKDDWQSAVTAAVLAGSPIGAPLLLTDGDEIPAVTQDTLDRLKPKGSDLSKDAQVIRIGRDVARPDGFQTAVIEGDDPYERAAAVDRFFSAAKGKPSANVVVVSGERSEWATPAAAWAARSGDAVLPVKRESVPDSIRKAIREHEKPNIYVLGPEKVIGKGALRELEKLGRRVRRIQGRTPVENSIAFARYERGGFGWGVVVPGYNFSLANTDRPSDAAAAASLAARGVFAPLLLTDEAERLPSPLEQYLLSVQPGYEDDPGQAVYNRVWLLGDDKAISLTQQSRLDQITELIPVQANAP